MVLYSAGKLKFLSGLIIKNMIFALIFDSILIQNPNNAKTSSNGNTVIPEMCFIFFATIVTWVPNKNLNEIFLRSSF